MRTDHLLIIRFSTLSDVAKAVPVVRALARQYPQLRITMLSQPEARPLFDGIAPNVGFMAADLKGEYHSWKRANALYRRLVAKNFTAVADFHNVLRSNYLRLRFNLGRFRVEHLDRHRHLFRRAKNGSQAQQYDLTADYLGVLWRLGYTLSADQLEAADGPTGPIGQAKTQD